MDIDIKHVKKLFKKKILNSKTLTKVPKKS